MDLVREAISDIRSSWDRYPDHMKELRALLGRANVDLSDTPENRLLTSLLSSRKEWTDRTDGSDDDDVYEAIRLYTSERGYRQIFSAINTAFRMDELSGDRATLRAATFLIELLNIDLFNYRARYKAADEFSGTVYRGMSLSPAELDLFLRASRGPISDRYLSVPLAMVSASSIPGPATAFALGEAECDPGKVPIIWEIQVEPLERKLLKFYWDRFPSSVVTSLCAVPIYRLSAYPEEEVLLRGPHFQIIQVTRDDVLSQTQPVWKVEALALNSNRDHVTAIATNEGADRRMRDLFRALIIVQRSTRCARRMEELGELDDAESYRSLAAQNQAIVDSY